MSQTEAELRQSRPAQPGLPIPLLPVSPHVTVATNPIATTEELRRVLTDPPVDEKDTTRILFRVSRSKLSEWIDTIGEAHDMDALAKEVRVPHFVLDLDALPEKDVFDLLKLAGMSDEVEVPSAHVFRHNGAEWVKQSEKSVSKPIDLTSLLCIEPVHTFAHLHQRIADAHKRGVTHLVTYSGATWCPPCRRIMPYMPSIIDKLTKELEGKGVSVELVKIDRDAAESIDQVYNVEYIPFLQIFKTSDVEKHTAALSHPLPALMPANKAEEVWWEEDVASAVAVALKPIATLQNSAPDAVTAFFERHCAPLSFDAEF